MARTIWHKRSWLGRLARPQGTRDVGRVQFDHGLFPWQSFQEKLQQERNRALRSNKPLVVMLLDAEKIGAPGQVKRPGEITESLSQAVNASVRESDICGLLKEDVLIGVILTEVEAEKVGAAQLVVADKVKKQLATLLSHDVAERVAISFHHFPASGENLALDRSSPVSLIEAESADPCSARWNGCGEFSGECPAEEDK